MAFSNRPYAKPYSSSGAFPIGVKWLLVANIGIFLLDFLVTLSTGWQFSEPFKLYPRMVVQYLAVWQLATYLFLHSLTQFSHILFNMLALWMFGADLERVWGTRRFVQYYFVCGVGAGLCVVIAGYLFGNPGIATIGSSGAIYGLLLAFGVLYPDRVLLFSFLFPIKAKYFVIIVGAIAFLSSLSANTGGVSNVAHLGGMLFGYAYLKGRLFDSASLLGNLQDRYRQFKIQRARRKFDVYMRKQDSRSDWKQ